MDIHRRAIARVREAARRQRTEAVRQTAARQRDDDDAQEREVRVAERVLREHDDGERERGLP